MGRIFGLIGFTIGIVISMIFGGLSASLVKNQYVLLSHVKQCIDGASIPGGAALFETINQYACKGKAGFNFYLTPKVISCTDGRGVAVSVGTPWPVTTLLFGCTLFLGYHYMVTKRELELLKLQRFDTIDSKKL